MSKRVMTKEALQDLYFTMLRIRMVEEKIAEVYPQQEIRCPIHLCIGQEAVAAGVCANLLNEDLVMSAHRSHGHYLAKGGDLKAMLAELYGKATGCSGGKGGSMHLTDPSSGFLGATPILGSTISIAVGAAFGTSMRGEANVVVVFFGEAATEEGIFHESINFAVLKNLPIVFICENNQYSVYSPISVRRPHGSDILSLANGHGIEGFKKNGNDVIEVHNSAAKAVAKARRGDGPTFLEFKTYRWLEHAGPFYDNDLGYRTEEEFQQWKENCPIRMLENKLDNLGESHATYTKEIEVRIEEEIDSAIKYAKESPFPDKSSMLDQIYCDQIIPSTKVK